MKYKLMGRSGLRVAEISLGTMTFGPDWGWGASKEESRKIFDAYAEAGGNFIDTANVYTNGTSENYVGEFVASDREHFIVATKYSLSTRADDPNFSGNHRKNMTQAVEASLKRLNTDYIDLYWVHAWDNMTPVDEVMRALDDMVRVGKVLYVGVSDTPAWVVSRANTMADLMGWSPFVALQIEYSLIQRTVEADLLPMARTLDLAVTPWAALGRGILTGKYKATEDKIDAADSKRVDVLRGRGGVDEKHLKIAEEVKAIARKIGATPAQVALNWVRQRHGVIIPVIGARTEAQIKDSLGCLQFELTAEDIKKLDDASAVKLGFPHDVMATDWFRQIIYGNNFDLIESHRR